MLQLSGMAFLFANQNSPVPQPSSSTFNPSLLGKQSNIHLNFEFGFVLNLVFKYKRAWYLSELAY